MALPPEPAGGAAGAGGKQGGKPSGGKPESAGGKKDAKAQSKPKPKEKGRGPSLTGNKERTKPIQGAPRSTRPSDPGGVGQGHPSPGGPRSSPFNASQKTLERAIKDKELLDGYIKNFASMNPPDPLEDLDEIKKKPKKVVKETYQPDYPDVSATPEQFKKKPKKTKYNIKRLPDGTTDVIREDYNEGER